MKLLVDENLPPRLARLLSDAGHDAVHVRDLLAAGASDPQIMELALSQQRTIVSADTDFGALLAQARTTAPSVVLVRDVADRRPAELAPLLAGHIAQLDQQLDQGAMVAVTTKGARVRGLPLR